MNLALFDFDGTITDCDTFTPFIENIIPPVKLLVGKWLLSPLIIGYKAGFISASYLRQLVVYLGLNGITSVEIKQKGQEYALTFLPNVIRPNALERLQWHLAAGDRVIVVSASLDAYLVPWCQQMGIELICAELAVNENQLTGRYQGGDCTGQEKANRVQQRVNLSDYPIVYAYGDTKEDQALLALAHEKYYQWTKV